MHVDGLAMQISSCTSRSTANCTANGTAGLFEVRTNRGTGSFANNVLKFVLSDIYGIQVL